MSRVWRGVLVVAAVVSGASCGADGEVSDLGAFCAGVDELTRASPFDGLDIASPREMRDAFDTLADAAQRLDDAAPPEASVQASRYLRAISDLTDELAVAGYDPTRIDTRAYGDRVEAYTDAAISFENAADRVCA